ncbi:MAG TPA: tRNA lysidine(34) synthetase TilS [Streptosporangiaceae bacterium]|nr:tRNA lysidine(34) synthetase TilS [Streptosporangiaceae bacterium]
MGPHPAVAAVRLAVRRSLADLGPQAVVLVGCSGGADSLALAAAAAFEAPRLGIGVAAVTVDHGLQSGSADRAAQVVTVLCGLGLHPVSSVRVDVSRRGTVAGYPGPEAAARQARYAALESAARACGAAAILLGHTMDDQAETVLLGLARGSGARSLAGMARSAGRYRRPLLGLRREQTRAACAALDLHVWDDPHNADPAFARVRVREQILPLMEELLGPGVTQALARTADRLRADADVLDDLTATAARELMRDWDQPPREGGQTLAAADLAALPPAVRTRVLKLAAVTAGVPPGSLSAAHVVELDALVTAWRGQRWTDLPGGVRCQRRYGRLHFTTRS